MADAAYVILTKDSKNFTGNFCIDDQVLKEVGVKDFSQGRFHLILISPFSGSVGSKKSIKLIEELIE